MAAERKALLMKNFEKASIEFRMSAESNVPILSKPERPVESRPKVKSEAIATFDVLRFAFYFREVSYETDSDLIFCGLTARRGIISLFVIFENVADEGRLNVVTGSAKKSK